MDVVLDACTVINLINGQVFQTITLVPGIKLFVGDNLLDQEILDDAQKILVEALLTSNSICILQSSVTIQQFLSLKAKYNLGDGETESIALCKKHNSYFASDDNRARKVATKELGENMVIGSIFLLREAVRSGLMSAEQSMLCLAIMKQKGGFLPKVDDSYFNS